MITLPLQLALALTPFLAGLGGEPAPPGPAEGPDTLRGVVIVGDAYVVDWMPQADVPKAVTSRRPALGARAGLRLANGLTLGTRLEDDGTFELPRVARNRLLASRLEVTGVG